MPDAITIPRLSETLRPVAYPFRCQRCEAYGGLTAAERLTVWQEHDDADRPESIFVLLCMKCADKVIDPHPRLYRRLAFNEPAPGVMRICQDCTHRAAGRCVSAMLRTRGGPGLRFPAPDSTVHVQRAGPKGRGRVCEWIKMWSEEPKECQGFEPRKESDVVPRSS